MDLGIASYVLWGVKLESSASFHVGPDNKIVRRTYSAPSKNYVKDRAQPEGLNIPEAPAKLMPLENLMVMGQIASAAKLAKKSAGRSSYKKDEEAMAYLEAVMAAEEVIMQKSLSGITEIAEEGEMGLHLAAVASFKKAFGSSTASAELREIKATLTDHDSYSDHKKSYSMYNKVLAKYLKKSKYQSIDMMQSVVDQCPEGYFPGLFENALEVLELDDLQ